MSPGPKLKLMFKTAVVEVSDTQSEPEPEPEAETEPESEAEAVSSIRLADLLIEHSFSRSPTQSAVAPTTPTKSSLVQNLENTSPFKGTQHSPAHAKHLAERSSKRGDPREGLFSRFERREPGLEYLNHTNALEQAKGYITTKDYKGQLTREEVTPAEKPFFNTAKAPSATVTTAATNTKAPVAKPKLEDSFTRLLDKERVKRAAEAAVTTNAAPAPAPAQNHVANSTPVPQQKVLRDPAALERKKAAAKKQAQLLDASLKGNAPNAATASANSSLNALYFARADTMNEPAQFFHALLRPSVIQILRAAGYHGCKPSVTDAVTDLAAKHLMTLATRTANYAMVVDNTTQVDVSHVRMAMEDLGALIPTLMIEDEIELPDGEDIRGVENFIEWANGPVNKEIRRVALEGADENGKGGVDYLTALMRKHDNVDSADGASRWDGTVLGKMHPPREVVIEGDKITSIKEWNKVTAAKRRADEAKAAGRAETTQNTAADDANDANENDKNKDADKDGEKTKTTNSTRQSSELSDIAEGDVESVDVDMEDS